MSEQLISVKLPLPISVVSELGTIIDKRWPGAALVVSEEGAPGWKIDPEHMHFRVDFDQDVPEDDEVSLDLNHIDPDGTMGFGSRASKAEEVSLGLVAMFKDILDEHDAPNFVTMTVLGQDEKYEVTVRRLGGKAPAEIMAEKDAVIAELESELAGTRGLVMGLEAALATYREAEA